MLDLTRRSILGITTSLNSSKVNSLRYFRIFLKSRAISSALVCLRPDFLDKLMILSRESVKDFCLNSSVKSYFTTAPNLSTFFTACIEAAATIFFALAAALLALFSSGSSPMASMGLSLSCSAVYFELQSPFRSALVFAGFLLIVRFSAGIVSGWPLMTSR